MKNILTIVILFFTLLSFGQSETHVFTTYDTTINAGYAGITWRCRISRPTNYFTPNHSDTASRPVIITIPGQGEMGTSYSTLGTWGPHYWMANGWDGSVVLGNGTHYPIIITAISSQTYMSGKEAGDLLSVLIPKFHPKGGKVLAGGLSQGAFAFSASLLYEKTTGDEFGMKQIKALVCLEGASSEVTAGNFDANASAKWGHWAAKYGGKFFGLEGTADFRTVSRVSKPMNDSSAGSGYFAYQNIGGGTHCCWNSMYDPSKADWRNGVGIYSGTYGTNVTGGSDPNTVGSYKYPSSIFQWMLRQGDTTLVTSGGGGGGNTAPTANAGIDQTITLPTNAITLSGSGNDVDGTISSYLWSLISGPNTPTITSTTSASTTVLGLIAGTYVFRLTVTDNSGATGTDDIQVQVNSSVGHTPQKYYWPTSDGNILISDLGRFGKLYAGDSIFIPAAAYRSYSIRNVNSGTPGQYIVVVWQQGAYRTPSASNNFADYIENASGVKTIGMVARDHVDTWRYGTAGYCDYLYFQDCNFNNSNGFGPTNVGALPPFDGTLTNASDHWTFDHCSFDTLKSDGGVSLMFGGQAFAPQRYSFNFDMSVINCSFSNATSNTLPCNFISAVASYNLLVDHCTFKRLGIVAHPSGHAAAINLVGCQGTFSNNIFGPDIFGNDIRGKFGDCLVAGTTKYNGTSYIHNNISFNKRKYPLYEVQQTDTTGFGGGYVRLRSAPQVSNITAYNVAIGAGGNTPYQTAIVDCYLTDSVHLKNSVLVGIRDTTWGTVYGPYLYTQSTGNITVKDTASNKLVQLWTNSGIADSVSFYPSPTGILYNAGVSVPSYITTDIYGTLRPNLGGVDIGAVEYVSGGNQLPTVNAGDDRILILQTSTILSGNASDNDGTIASYAWTNVSGPNTPTIVSPTNATTSITGLTLGVYVFRLTVTDNQGGSSYDDVIVLVVTPSRQIRQESILKKSNQ